MTAAAAAMLVGIVGLSAVLGVQARAKAAVVDAMGRETEANRALGDANHGLARSKDAVQDRHNLAVAAIKAFHIGVSEDFLLKQDQFKDLRDRLLKSAADFYGRLGALLGKETDLTSRRALAASNFELLWDTGKVPEAEHRRALDIERTLTRDHPDVDEYRGELAAGNLSLGILLMNTGRAAESEAEYRAALGIREELEQKHPRDAGSRLALAVGHNPLGDLLATTGRAAEAETHYRTGLSILRALADEHPGDGGFRESLANTRNTLAILLINTGQSAAAEPEYREAPALYTKLDEQNPTVTSYQGALANTLVNLANARIAVGRHAEAEAAVGLLEAFLRREPRSVFYGGVMGEALLRRGQTRLAGGDAAGAVSD